MYVLVNTCFDFESGETVVTTVFGPYSSKEEAEEMRQTMGFPNPDQVFVRKMWK